MSLVRSPGSQTTPDLSRRDALGEATQASATQMETAPAGMQGQALQQSLPGHGSGTQVPEGVSQPPLGSDTHAPDHAQLLQASSMGQADADIACSPGQIAGLVLDSGTGLTISSSSPQGSNSGQLPPRRHPLRIALNFAGQLSAKVGPKDRLDIGRLLCFLEACAMYCAVPVI